MKKLIIIRCVVDHSHGYGHFSRCLSIAEYFSKKNYSVIFLINENVYIKKELLKSKFNFYIVPRFKKIISEGNFLKKFIFENNASCLIIDMKEFSENISKEIQNCKCLTVVIDDSSVTNIYSDILLNGTPIKQYHDYKLYNKRSQLLLGSKYFLNNPEFFQTRKKNSEIKIKKNYKIVVSCGGSDVNNLTWKIINEIVNLPNLQIQVIVGSLMKKNAPSNIIKNNVKIINSPKKIWNIFNKSDLVICTSGSTLFELAIQGIPCINIATVKHQIAYGKYFSKSGFGIYMGFWKQLNFSKFSSLLEGCLSDSTKRKKMSSTGKKLIDGRGLERFEKVIASRIKKF
jgi:UDP-2,4-diacetamido-2,4,6-trideoxy-beta-L-altropyranose hydrolase